MDQHEATECPFCLERMLSEEREEDILFVCPNGCPTEIVVRKPPASAPAAETAVMRARSGA
ncbi:MAG: hypothetical protein ABSB35_00790 [Bryobacteraceae bacterium]|jgi:hypothetical protein